MNPDINEYLRNFKVLLDDGLITQEEFDAKKAELLSVPNEQDSSKLAPPTSEPVMMKNTFTTLKRERNWGVLIGDIIMLLVGFITFVAGGSGNELSDIRFQADYYTHQYEATVVAVQAINKVVMAIGVVLICFGLRGLLKELLDKAAPNRKAE